MIIKSITKLQKACEPTTLERGLEITDELDAILSLEPGIGLAANQIGLTEAVCIIRVPKEIDGEMHTFGHNFINPIVTKLENPFMFKNEGCLSFPNVYIETVRYKSIIVKDLLEPSGRLFTDLEAVCAQHEIDHLFGKTMYDSIKKTIGPNGRCPCKSGKKFKKCCSPFLNQK